jgi:large subunit ribosomal protein L13
VLGRLASQIATVLQGKDKPTYAPHVENGDVCCTQCKGYKCHWQKNDRQDLLLAYRVGQSLHKLSYASYSELLLTSSGDMLDPQQVYWASEGKKAQGPDGKRPTEVIRKAVLRMLPRNRLRDVSETSLRF